MKVLDLRDNIEYTFSYPAGSETCILMWDQKHGTKGKESIDVIEMLDEIISGLKDKRTKIISIDNIEIRDLIRSVFANPPL